VHGRPQRRQLLHYRTPTRHERELDWISVAGLEVPEETR
jgi:hypothetical protein